MVRIRREKGGNGIGPYWWPEDDPVCDVPEELARDLLGRPEEEGFSVEPDPEPQEPEPEGDGDDPDGDGEQDPPGPEDGDGDGDGAGDQEPEKPPAKLPARRSRAKGATA